MRVRNVWFDLLTFFGAVFMVACAVGSIVDYIRGERVSFSVAALAIGAFLLFGLFFFRISLQLGNRQRKVRESSRVERWRGGVGFDVAVHGVTESDLSRGRNGERRAIGTLSGA